MDVLVTVRSLDAVLGLSLTVTAAPTVLLIPAVIVRAGVVVVYTKVFEHAKNALNNFDWIIYSFS